jgi:hypothetical protein
MAEQDLFSHPEQKKSSSDTRGLLNVSEPDSSKTEDRDAPLEVIFSPDLHIFKKAISYHLV